MALLLKGKVAAVFAAGGEVGSSVSRVLAREGAAVFLSGRRLASIESLAKEIRSAGSVAHAAEVDAMDEKAIDSYLDREVVARAGRIDVVFNAIGVQPVDAWYGTPCTAIPFDRFLLPIATHVGSQFLTSRLAARHMQAQKKPGVILLLSASVSTDSRPFMANITAACAAIECMGRSLAAELGRSGVRVVCLRPRAMAGTRTIRQTYEANTKTIGMAPEEFARAVRDGSPPGRPATTPGDVAEMAAFLVSDKAVTLAGRAVEV